MTEGPRVAGLNPDRRARLGDHEGVVRVPNRDTVYARLLNGAGTVVRAYLPHRAVERISGSRDDLLLPPKNTPIWLRLGTSGSPNRYVVITDSLPIITEEAP